ncbi:21188_t:CDS:1, partial [Gigaspora margarita]
PSTSKQIHNHCQCLWSKVKHAYQQCIKVEKVSLEQLMISEAISQNLQEKKIIANELTKKILEENVNMKGYHHIFDPQCFKNAFGETIVDLCTFQSSSVAKSAKEVVQQYYDY